MSHNMTKPAVGVSDQVRHNQAVRLQKVVRGSKFHFDSSLQGLYYLCSENKGTDHRAADLHLCFGIYAKSRFSHDPTNKQGVF